MAGRYSPGTTRDLEEFAAATELAREHRAVVAEQLSATILSYDVQGSAQVAVTRVRAVAVADQEGDTMLLRAAIMDAAATFAAWAAELDARSIEGRGVVADRIAARELEPPPLEAAA